MPFTPLEDESNSSFTPIDDEPTQATGPMVGSDGVGVGGLGYPVSREQAKIIAAQRVVDRERARGVKDLATTEELNAAGLLKPTALGKAMASMMGVSTELDPGEMHQLGASDLAKVQAATLSSVVGAPAIARGIEKMMGVDPRIVQAAGTGTIDQNPEAALTGQFVGGMIAPGAVATKVLNPYKMAALTGAGQSMANYASDQYSRDQEITKGGLLASAGTGSVLGLGGAAVAKSVPILAEKAKNVSKELYDMVRYGAGNKPFIADSDITKPIILARKATKDNPVQFGKVSDVFDEQDSYRLSRAAPPTGHMKEFTKTSQKIQNGYGKLFKSNPGETKDVISTLNLATLEAPKVYQQYLDIGNSRPDIMVDMSSLASKSKSKIHDLSDPEMVAQFGKAEKMYEGKVVPLPIAINKLQEVNGELAPLIKQGDTTSYQYKALKFQAEEIKEMIDPLIEKIGGKRASELRTTYGELAELSKSLSVTAKKLAVNIPPEHRGSMNDLIGSGEILGAGINMVTSGVNPVNVALTVHGILKKIQAQEKLDWTNANKQLLKLNNSLSKKIKFQDNIDAPEGWNAPKVPYVQQPLPAKISPEPVPQQFQEQYY